MSDVTQILEAIERGDAGASADLLPLVYSELRALAARKLAQEKPGQTLQPTALVHEAYLRLVGADEAPRWHSRGHFFGAAAEAMRRILVETARRKKRARHGGGRKRIILVEDPAATQEPGDLLALDEALARLEADDAEAVQVAKLRLFAGLSVTEAAKALGVSRAHAYRQWAYALAWLRSALNEDTSTAS